jgi:hypothetical protein
MSRIWDSLKDLERQQKHRGNSDPPQLDPLLLFEHRDGERVRVSLPVFVYGHSLEHEPFYESSELLFMNSLGGLITLQSTVAPGQKLLLTNKSNQEEVGCRVVGVRSKYLQRFAIAIAFEQPLSDSWTKAT